MIWVFWQTAYKPKPSEESTSERPRCRTEMEEMMYSLNLLAAEKAKSILIVAPLSHYSPSVILILIVL